MPNLYIASFFSISSSFGTYFDPSLLVLFRSISSEREFQSVSLMDGPKQKTASRFRTINSESLSTFRLK